VTALLWFTRDLRLHDHPALDAALAAHDRVVPVFCLDARLLHGRHASGPRAQFMLECLADLDGALRARGSALVVREGPPERELPALAVQAGAGAVYCSADATPFARARTRRVRAALAGAGMRLCAQPGLHAIDDLAEPVTRDGRPYSVFSPFHRAWLGLPRREVLAPPDRLPPVPYALGGGGVPSLAALGLTSTVADPLRGGETRARARAERFLAEPVRRYDRANDAPAADGTSRLSPYLHFGCVSPRELEQRLPAGEGAEAYRRQLCWRDFHHHVLLHHPDNARRELQPAMRGLRWSADRELFAAWCEGRTGYPFVDAGMRQLAREGWMHNRVRLVVGSFLTKDLAIDWRWGERWFMRMLVDGDEANNNGNWQWIASVGTDPQPAYRRICIPARQQERLDPDGVYVRRHVPELRSLPQEFLAEPWLAPDDVQRECGCVIGRDYPGPVVDHAVARRAALERYGGARASS
jgi:deoxyribodipyrimidine photo-lyase